MFDSFNSDVDARISSRAPSRSINSSRRKATLKKFSSQFSSALSITTNGNLNGRTSDAAASPGESDSDKDKVSIRTWYVYVCIWCCNHAYCRNQANTAANTEKPKPRSAQLKPKKPLLIDTHYSGTPTGLLNMKSHFVLVFGDHTYQQYGLCMRMPMKFTDPILKVGL
jgi:hypothetical protein